MLFRSPQAERGDRPLDDEPELGLGDDDGHALERTPSLHPAPGPRVDHHLRHLRVGEQRLERAEAGEIGEELGHDRGTRLGGQQRRGVVDER